MILQAFRDLEQRFRDAGKAVQQHLADTELAGGGTAMWAVYDQCADELEEVREALEARLEQAVAFIQEIAEMERCDDPDKRRECSSGSGPYCETHDPIVIDVEIEQARVIMADLAACLVGSQEPKE